MPTNKAKQANKPLFFLLAVLATAALGYLGFTGWLYAGQRFPLHTSINGHDVSLKRATDAQRVCMADYYPNMSFTITAPGMLPCDVTPLSFDFSAATRAKDYLPDNVFLWPASLFQTSDFHTTDGGAIEKLARHLEASVPTLRGTPATQSAYLKYNGVSDHYDLISESGGTVLDRAAFESVLREHVRHGSGVLDLGAAHVYREAETVLPRELLETQERLNRFLSATVVFDIGEEPPVFEVRALLPYVTLTSAHEVRYDAEAAAADGVFDDFAALLEKAYKARSGVQDFITHDGETVPVTLKTWRPKLDIEATVQSLAQMTFEELSASDDPLSGTLVWDRPTLRELKDYVEVDLDNQMLYLYRDGEQILESPIVSGSLAARHRTPGGAYTLTAKRRNVTLRGPDYANFVRYWMPFNGAIGLHDAPWRRSFGGTIYRANGSHGCINLPTDVAAELYENIEKGWAVVCYWRSVVQNG